MTAYTSGFEIPYPEGTDLVKDGPQQMEDLATQVDTQMGYLVNRNIIINGNMQVWQRSTSRASITTFGYYSADRWRTDLSSLGTWTQSRDTDVPTGRGFGYSLKMDNTTADLSPAAGDYGRIQQRVEGQNLQNVRKGTANAKPLTLSFWVKTTIGGTMIVELEDVTNSRFCSASISTTANTWVYRTATFPADTTGTWPNDNTLALQVNFWIGAGSNFTGGGSLQTTWGTATNTRAFGQTNFAQSTTYNVWITGVQLELGDADTPYEFEPYVETLTKCLRYYYKPQGGVYQGVAYATTACFFHGNFPTMMRADCALEDPGGPYTNMINRVITATTYTPSGISAQSLSMQSGGFVAVGLPAVFVVGDSAQWTTQNVAFGAEL